MGPIDDAGTLKEQFVEHLEQLKEDLLTLRNPELESHAPSMCIFENSSINSSISGQGLFFRQLCVADRNASFQVERSKAPAQLQ